VTGWRRLTAAAALLPALVACRSLDVLPAEATLRDATSDAALADAARQAIAAADAAPADAAQALAASRWLFLAADHRLQRATCEWLRAHPDATRAEVLAADDRLGDDVRAEVASLCARGLQFAERTLRERPDDVDARLHEGLHASLLAWAQGATKALMAGYGRRIGNAIDATVARDPGFAGASPLRLAGRFRSKAPWPYGDKAGALVALQRATQSAPGLINHLFYGDALAASRRMAEAEVEWDAALRAPADDATRWSAPLLREQARRRLAAPPAR
jgi:hypothetical protein